ncbi:glycosyltransferase [Paenibacillus ihuae]|uniref:glycosyltransferase n=1 Tax=Paenibacillus ihuae TaxID=1232431 RepID=UPI0006D5527C|nr:glycosyltransferase [Paenibacillus ihuae]
MKRVLLIHNYYQQSGGEDKVVAQEAELLRSRGIEVQIYSVHNDDLKNQGTAGKVKTALSAAWSPSAYKKIKQQLLDMKPDVVHVHNFFPLISPSVYYACNRMGVPVVQTLHNYRLLCPAATFLRDGSVCEKCLHGSLIHSVINGCYRGSKVETLPVVSMIAMNQLLGTWNNKVDRYIALTEFSRNKFVEGGIPAERITVKPNFISTVAHSTVPETGAGKYMLYVGRISAEKGVKNLLKAWSGLANKDCTELLVVGDGPEKEKLEDQYSGGSIHFLGNQPGEKVLELMSEARYLVVPSIWYEGFPMTIVEAYSVGTPVLCSRIGSLQEIVPEGVTGFQFAHDDIGNMASVLRQALDYEEYPRLRETVKERFNALYTEEANFIALSQIYDEVVKEKDNENRFALQYGENYKL